MNKMLKETLDDCPIIAAVKDMGGLEKCLSAESKIIFVLFGDILNIGKIVEKIKAADKIAFVHMDLIQGLGNKDISVDFIKANTLADGIITTKPALIKRAKSVGLYTILRFFIIDSMALRNIEKQGVAVDPDLIEVLPGVMPKVISRICKSTSIPIIAGGLIMDKEDIINALAAGAISISTTDQDVWFM